jgi:hypothetical protein
MPQNAPFAPRDAQELREQVEREYVAHLANLATSFNRRARERGLGITLDATKAIEGARNFQSSAAIHAFLNREDDSGVLHEAQLLTALDCVAEMLVTPRRNGLVLGAMQSGKTTTSLALQFAGPMVYLLTGRKIYPIYLVTNHTSQEDQTSIELRKFWDFYGRLELIVDERHRCTLVEYAGALRLDLLFTVSPTIETYRQHILRNALPDTILGPRIEDFIHRRVPGQSIQRIADLCRRANQGGYSPLLILDEPQYGASDRLVRDEDGNLERRPCVLVQIFDRIEQELGENVSDHVFIGLSATPYELHDLSAVWEVKQYLTSAYSGFNYFQGEVISVGVETRPPETLGFSELATRMGRPFLAKVDLAAYDGTPQAFDRFARRVRFNGAQDTYRASVETGLRATIYDLIEREAGREFGICLRLFNDNRKSHDFLQRLRLDPERVEVLEWFGADYKGQSVKRAISGRRRPDLPFIVVVTNRARMGDAFPSSVEWFFDFSRKASDLNALLQGLLGRACGYNKSSTVVMSDENAQIVSAYQRTQGGIVHRASRHSITVGGYRRGAPTSLVRLHADMDDPLVREFFQRVNDEIVEQQLVQGVSSLRPRNRVRPYRTGPVLRIAGEMGLFEHLERPDTRARLLPSFPDGFRVARQGDVVRRARPGAAPLTYTVDPEGNVRFTFRWTIGNETHSGIQSRGYGARDSADRSRAGDSLEPQVHVRKISADSGEWIDDKDQVRSRRVPGNWVAHSVVFPLVDPIREVRAAELAYPVELSPYSELMDDEERTTAGFPLRQVS